jgi:hypothetical protein
MYIHTHIYIAEGTGGDGGWERLEASRERLEASGGRRPDIQHETLSQEKRHAGAAGRENLSSASLALAAVLWAANHCPQALDRALIEP